MPRKGAAAFSAGTFRKGESAVLACLHEERFQDCSPAQVYAALLDEGRFHCSIRTMSRLLEAGGENRERRDQLTHPPYQKPELLATAANQLWNWDITNLYVILDVFSRFVVGWMIACRENAVLPSGSEHRGRPTHPARRSRSSVKAKPERFVRKPPRPPSLPTAVWINRPPKDVKIP